jgi:hypothetical protein
MEDALWQGIADRKKADLSHSGTNIFNKLSKVRASPADTSIGCLKIGPSVQSEDSQKRSA